MAERLDLVVIAEGIERTEQRDALRDIGCPLGQGYLFGQAVPADEFLLQLAAARQVSPQP